MTLKTHLRGIKRKIQSWIRQLLYRLRYGALGKYIIYAQEIPGWSTNREMFALARASYQLPANAVIVEIGSFLGRSSVLLAGARKVRGSGKLHCVDPFDASGDDVSVPIYQDIISAKPMSQRQQFDQNLQRAGVTSWVDVHKGTAETVGLHWQQPIDLLFLDGDQSPQGVRSAYELWSPWLKVGGLLVVHNSADRDYVEGHDGHRRLVVETIHPPEYEDVTSVTGITFARKALKK
ncbi:MAG: class I SAM-dependent methyltransferase [Cyanobacteria bacterium]|nr:class I SAM-dependent methyltransferase [Cyanobacteriota bacterium]MDW8201484.1 class I SAM-dependent methyltransferase [Cyanobacteriota bacterium SKYGB_h_bin112]